MSGAVSRGPEVPRAALVAAGALISLAIAGAGLSRHEKVRAAPEIPPIATRLLAFADQPDGSVAVTDAQTGRPVVMLPKGQDNFIRATLRDLVHTRFGAGGGRPAPFALTIYESGRLTLTDTADGRTLELEAFGPANAGDFARLLTAEEPAP